MLFVVLLAVVVVGPAALALFMFWAHRTSRLQDPSFRSRFGPLCVARVEYFTVCVRYEVFRTDRFFWSACVLVRRITLVGIVTFLTSTDNKYMWLSCANVLFVTAHTLVRPFETSRDNFAELVALTVLALISTMLTAFDIPLSFSHSLIISLLVFLPGGTMLLLFLHKRLAPALPTAATKLRAVASKIAQAAQARKRNPEPQSSTEEAGPSLPCKLLKRIRTIKAKRQRSVAGIAQSPVSGGPLSATADSGLAVHIQDSDDDSGSELEETVAQDDDQWPTDETGTPISPKTKEGFDLLWKKNRLKAVEFKKAEILALKASMQAQMEANARVLERTAQPLAQPSPFSTIIPTTPSSPATR